jgi:hypothetical protein
LLLFHYISSSATQLYRIICRSDFHLQSQYHSHCNFQHSHSLKTTPKIFIMPIPSYGAAPLSVTFLGVRLLQVVCLAVILGMTGSFVNEMIMQDHEPSKEIVGTLAIVSIRYFFLSWSFTNLTQSDCNCNPLHIGFHRLLVVTCKPRSLCHGWFGLPDPHCLDRRFSIGWQASLISQLLFPWSHQDRICLGRSCFKS